MTSEHPEGPMQQNNTADILYRVTGGVMLLSGLWNAFMSFVWFISMIWVCIGVLWIIPGLMSLAYCGVGIYMLATGQQTRPAAFAPAAGLVISVLNFNIFGGMMDLVALVLGIVGFTQANQADQLTG